MLDCPLIAPPGFEPAVQSDLLKLGYSVLPGFFEPDEFARVQAMWDFFSEKRNVMSPMNLDESYKSTLTTATDRDVVFRQIVNGALITDVTNAVRRVTDGYRVIGAGFIDKEPGFALLPMHQDTSIVQDESKIQCVTIWVALVDVDESNGGLSMIPCSHLHHRSPRALFTPFPGRACEDELRKNFSRQVPLKAGEAVVFDRSVFHDSAPNPTDSRRPAVQIVLAPKHQPAYYHMHREVNGQAMLDCYSVPDHFFLTHVFGTEPPVEYKVGTMPEKVDTVCLETLAALQKASATHHFKVT